MNEMFSRPLLIRTKVMPYESLTSLVYRLAHANFFDHGWKICRLTDVPGNLFRNQNLLSDRNIIGNLAFINNCSENEIFNTTVHRFAGCFSENNNGVLSSDAIEKFFLSISTRYCPLCLKESRYHKIHWEVLPVTMCLKHKVLLQDFCPKCHRRVKIRWVLRNKCKCGGDLLSVDPISVASCTEALRNQVFIQNLLGINESGYLERVSNIPAAELSPHDFFKLLKIFSMLISNKLPESSRFLRLDGLTAEPIYQIEMKNGISNFANFILTHSASSILLDWPQKFYEFLEDYSKMERSKRWKTGVEKSFGGLKERLFAKLDEEKFGFVYHAYCNYLNERWTGGNLGNVKIFDTQGGKNLQRKHITQEEAAKVLDRDHKFVSKLIIQKLIKTVIHDVGSTKRYVIDSDSVYSLKKEMNPKRGRDKMSTCSDLAVRLDIGVRNVKLLIKSGLIPSVEHKPWGRDSSLFEPEDVEKFEKEFLSKERYTVVDKKPEGYLSTLDAVEAISCTNSDTPGLLQLVRQGIFNPILCRDAKGLSRLLFSEDELKKYRDSYFDKKSSKFAVYRVCNILGVNERTVQRLINEGLIKAAAEGVDGKQKTYVLKKDLEDFKREYLFLENAATLFGFDTETILQGIKQGRLKDYSGIPITKPAKNRIFRKEEIEIFIPENSMNKWKQTTLIPCQEL